MKTPSVKTYREIVTGKRQGPLAALLRWSLSVAEVPYRMVVTQRNRRFDRGSSEIQQVPVPVLSVGNLTLGGTGKTPLVAWIARWFRQRDIRVAIVSRGYGAGADATNDEAQELQSRLPDVPHLQDPNRVRAARSAVEKLESQLIILDDGFQHRRLARDLDLVLIDATEPFGGGRVFPRGLLREPISSLKRADVVVLTRSHLIAAAQREQIRQQVMRQAPHVDWLEASHHPTGLLSASGQTCPVRTWSGARVAAFCGIGNPQAFRDTLTRQGWQIARFREFPDHHRYTQTDVESLARELAIDGVQAVLCTHKDLVKLGTDHLGALPLLAVLIDLTIEHGQSELESRLQLLRSRVASI